MRTLRAAIVIMAALVWVVGLAAPAAADERSSQTVMTLVQLSDNSGVRLLSGAPEHLFYSP